SSSRAAWRSAEPLGRGGSRRRRGSGHFDPLLSLHSLQICGAGVGVAQPAVILRTAICADCRLADAAPPRNAQHRVARLPAAEIQLAGVTAGETPRMVQPILRQAQGSRPCEQSPLYANTVIDGPSHDGWIAATRSRAELFVFVRLYLVRVDLVPEIPPRE